MDEDQDRLIHLLHSQGQPFARIADRLGISVDEATAGYARDLQRVTDARAQLYITLAVQARARVQQLETDPHGQGRQWRQTLALYRKVAQEMTAEAQRLNPEWEPPA